MILLKSKNIFKIFQNLLISKNYSYLLYMNSYRITNKQNTEALLKEQTINYTIIDHEAVKNVAEGLEKVKNDKIHDFVFAKNLFLKSKDKSFYLLTAHHESTFKFTYIEQFLKAKGIRTAEEKDLNEILGVQAGAVNPFSLVNDSKKQVKFLLDKALYNKHLCIHPMVNSSSVFLETNEFLTFLKKNNIEHIEIDFKQENQKEEVKQTKDHHKEQTKDHHKETKNEIKEPKQKESKEHKQKKIDEHKTEDKKDKAKKGKEDDEIKNTLGIEFKKEDDFAMWYQQIITKAEMVEYYDISGCYILRPWSYMIWEAIQKFFDDKIKTIGVENTYFPLFVTEKQLSKEESHIKGFKPEVAWVTRSGDTPLANPIAIRPTSETIMYPSFSKWIRSHRDLPLKINQWTNIVRWEFKNPTPFLRTREFLWQEGHTAHSTFEDSNKMVFDILEFYRQVYEDLLAVPVIKGVKTESEKFAGALFTSTVESAIPSNGKGIQCATSHHLGQNFSKMFDIKFSNLKEENEYAWQTSWGLSTRSIGIVIMTHSDNNGLVLPPRIAPIQVVFVPIIYKDDDSKDIITQVDNVYAALKSAGIKCKVDDRDNYNPGWKFFHWELKGVPIRVEVGKKDLKLGQMTIYCRDNGEKIAVKIGNVTEFVIKLLDTIQNRMFLKAQSGLNNMKKEAHDFNTFYDYLCNKNICVTAHCNAPDCEENVLEKVKSEAKKRIEQSEADDDKDKFAASAKTLCIPLDEQKNLKAGDKCFFCGAEAKKRVLWGKSY